MKQRLRLDLARLYATVALVVLVGAPALAQVEPARGQRDPDIAVQEEFGMAESGNTAQGWRLFIARHPDHPLAAEARKRLAASKR